MVLMGIPERQSDAQIIGCTPPIDREALFLRTTPEQLIECAESELMTRQSPEADGWEQINSGSELVIVFLWSFSFILFLYLFALFYYTHTCAYVCAHTHRHRHTRICTHLFSYFLFVLHILSIHICAHFGLFMGLMSVLEQEGLCVYICFLWLFCSQDILYEKIIYFQ